jgi:hypothetical protein
MSEWVASGMSVCVAFVGACCKIHCKLVIFNRLYQQLVETSIFEKITYKSLSRMSFTICKTIFISGSAYEYGRFGDNGRFFVRDLSKALLHNGFRIISGHGLGIGPAIIEGALHEIYREADRHFGDYLRIYPFPPTECPEGVWQHYRKDIISQAGIAIFLFGNKLEDISIREADGMLKEFEIARTRGALLIPVGSSGYVSEKLWASVLSRYDDYFENREIYDLFQQLGDPSLEQEDLIRTIVAIAGSWASRPKEHRSPVG